MKSFDRLTKAEKAKVIAAAVVIALLIGFPLIVALARRTTSSRLPSIDFPVIGSIGGETTVLDEPIDERASFDGDKVKGLDVTWNGGEVRLVRGTGADVVVRARLGAGTYDMDPRHSSISLDESTGTLIVDDGLPESNNGLEYPAFSLTIELPKGLSLSSVDLSGTSAGMGLDQVVCDHLIVSTVSSGITVQGLDAGRAEVASISGPVSFDGAVTTDLSVTSVSGALDVTLAGGLPPQTALDSTSGSITLDVPDDAGFTLTSDRVSSGFACELGELAERDEPGSLSAQVVNGDGSAQITADSISGSVRVK